MNLTKEYLNRKTDAIVYSVAFPYKLDRGIRKCIENMMTTMN